MYSKEVADARAESNLVNMDKAPSRAEFIETRDALIEDAKNHFSKRQAHLHFLAAQTHRSCEEIADEARRIPLAQKLASAIHDASARAMVFEFVNQVRVLKWLSRNC